MASPGTPHADAERPGGFTAGPLAFGISTPLSPRHQPTVTSTVFTLSFTFRVSLPVPGFNPVS